MIICINYSDDGERHIVYMVYDSSTSLEMMQKGAKLLKQCYDEVYVIDFKENKEFVDEVVLRGCRI